MPKIIKDAKARILEEGKRILIEKGYKELNIRDIARECGIGIGTVYNYFPGKEELVNSIFRNDWDMTIGLIEELKNSKLPLKEKLRNIYESLESFVDNYILIFRELSSSKGYLGRDQHNYEILYEKIEELLAADKNRGIVSSSFETKELAIFIVSNLMFLVRNKYTSFEKLFENMKI